jgi:outer membrane beta-barrel protein
MKFNLMGSALFVSVFLITSVLPVTAFAEDDEEAVVEETAKSDDDDSDFKERPLDGVTIEALETYRNPKNSQLTFDVSMLPFNAYYTGFGINAAYIYVINKTWAAEMTGAYIYSVEKGLTSELAQNYAVNPESIERIQTTVAGNAIYYHSYGKFILLKEYIRYFRSGFLLGAGYVITNTTGYVAGSLGWKFEVYVNDVFSWKFEIRDLITAQKGVTNNVAFSLGTAYSF